MMFAASESLVMMTLQPVLLVSAIVLSIGVLTTGQQFRRPTVWYQSGSSFILKLSAFHLSSWRRIKALRSVRKDLEEESIMDTESFLRLASTSRTVLPPSRWEPR